MATTGLLFGTRDDLINKLQPGRGKVLTAGDVAVVADAEARAQEPAAQRLQGEMVAMMRAVDIQIGAAVFAGLMGRPRGGAVMMYWITDSGAAFGHSQQDPQDKGVWYQANRGRDTEAGYEPPGPWGGMAKHRTRGIRGAQALSLRFYDLLSALQYFERTTRGNFTYLDSGMANYVATLGAWSAPAAGAFAMIADAWEGGTEGAYTKADALLAFTTPQWRAYIVETCRDYALALAQWLNQRVLRFGDVKTHVLRDRVPRECPRWYNWFEQLPIISPDEIAAISVTAAQLEVTTGAKTSSGASGYVGGQISRFQNAAAVWADMKSTLFAPKGIQPGQGGGFGGAYPGSTTAPGSGIPWGWIVVVGMALIAAGGIVYYLSR